MKRLVRTLACVAAIVLVVAPVAEGRGGGAGRGIGGGGGVGAGRRGGGRAEGMRNAQSQMLVSECVRGDNVRRMRQSDW